MRPFILALLGLSLVVPIKASHAAEVPVRFSLDWVFDGATAEVLAVILHPNDAEQRGIAAGAPIRVLCVPKTISEFIR